MAAQSNKKSNSSIAKLIEAGKEEAQNVQEIKSVAASEKTEAPETGVGKEVPVQIIEEPEIVEQEDSKTPKAQERRGLSMLLVKREVKDSEAVKIPRELHRELKMLASMSGVNMMQMLGNLIENFFEENQKEIMTYKKRYLNGTLGKK